MGIRESKKIKTKNKIIDSANALFKIYGYENVSMEQIAIKSEIGVGTLYNYFGNKAEIFVIAFSQSLGSKSPIIEIDEIKGDSIGDIIFNYCREYLNVYYSMMGFKISKKLLGDMILATLKSFKSNKKMINKLIKEDLIMISKIEEMILDLKEKKLLSSQNSKDLAENIYSVFAFEFLFFIFGEGNNLEDMENNIKRKLSQIID